MQVADNLVSLMRLAAGFPVAENEMDPLHQEEENTFATFVGDDILECMANIAELAEIIANVVDIANNMKLQCSRRRWGVHPINQLRREHGHFANLFREMRNMDHDKFFNYTRMLPGQFDDLLELIAPHITKMSSNAIDPECRLLITLR